MIFYFIEIMTRNRYLFLEPTRIYFDLNETVETNILYNNINRDLKTINDAQSALYQ